MAIIEFRQKGYKRLKDITEIELIPKSKMQLILGTNGSGKSALMKELSILSSSRNDYNEGGYKDVYVQHKGSIYRGMSDFRGSKNHFLLYKDGEMIYEGHSATVYDTHVKEEFSLTKDIHNVRIGVKRLSTMSRDERREWFTALCPDDYDYAVSYYKRLGTVARDIKGSVNRFNERLMKEKEKKINAETEATIRKEIEELKKARSAMMMHWRPMETTVDQALGKVQDIDRTLTELVNDFNISLKAYCNAKGYKDATAIWQDISDTQSKLTVIDNTDHDIHEQLEANQVLLSEAIVATTQDEAVLKAELAENSRSLIDIRSILKSDGWLNDPIIAKQHYEQVFSELVQKAAELLDDPDLIYSAANHQNSIKELGDLQLLIDGLTREHIRHNTIVQTYEHRSQEDHTECPKCQHTWIRGYSVEMHDQAVKERDSVFTQLEALKEKHAILHNHIEKSSYQLQILSYISLIAREHPQLSPMWKEITHTRLLQTKPKEAIEVIKSCLSEIELSIQYNEHKAKCDEINTALKQLSNASGLNYQELNNKSTALEAKLINLQTQAYIYNQSLSGLKRAQKAMEFQEKFTIQVDDLISKRNDFIQQAEIANKHEAINSILSFIESDISEKESILNQIDSHNLLIHTLEQEVQQLSAKEKLLKKAWEALSPSKGLIAKGMTGFINHFTAQMNAVIEKVWVYPLVIQPITVKEGEKFDLDYELPFYVDDKPAGKDISEGSGAQIEIFDMAFMLVSMMHLGMDETEIFLDEFSIKMDHGHRIEAMKMVTDLVTQSDFSQIFMISHYESSYGALSDMDITVMCPLNIKIPSDLPYNVNSKVIY